MKAIAGVRPVAFLAATLALGSCARDAEIERPSPEGRDIGPGLWRYLEPLGGGDSRDPLLERVKELARRERATVPKAPAGGEAPASEEAPSADVSATDVADDGDGDEDEKVRSVAGRLRPAPPGPDLRPGRVSPLPASAQLRLGPGDELDVVVGGQPEFSGVVTVRDDGHIALPTTGDLVGAAELATGQLAGAVARALHPRYLKSRPEVSVSLRSSPRLVYYVFGAVRRPGIHTMPPAGITVLDAVLAASRETDAPGRGSELVRGEQYERVHVVAPAGGAGEDVKLRIVDVASAMRGKPGPRELVPPGSRVIVPTRSGEFSEAALKRRLYPDGLPLPEKRGGAR